MTIKQLKIANVLIWVGVALFVLGMVLSYPTFAPYFQTLARTDDLITAPPLDPELSQLDGTPEANLLPFEGEEESYSRLGAALEPDPDTPVLPTVTPLPTPTVVPEPTLVSSPEATASPTPIPTPSGTRPKEISIPAIDLDAPVVPIGWKVVGSGADAQAQWLVPDWKAVGWHNTSALLGVPGNTVLNGHNTTHGEVFRDLYKLEPEAHIVVRGENGQSHVYKVENIYILEEAGQPLEVRLENARYILPTTDERLTLITCHPYASTRYRLIVIAKAEAPPDLAPE
jgi:LPXTG-site transpeptidase (sortase) family protein